VQRVSLLTRVCPLKLQIDNEINIVRRFNLEYKYITLDTTDNRLDITLKNPPVNIFTGAMMTELSEVLNDALKMDHLRAVVLKSTGKAWSAGADVSEHLPDSFAEMLRVFGSLCNQLFHFPLPTIAAVDGLCLGGGFEIAAMCDFIISSERSYFGQPEIKVGVFPPIACAHFVKRAGLSNTLEIVLTGDAFKAETMMRMELVHKVVPVESFAQDVDDFVGRLTCNSGTVLRLTKQAALDSLDLIPKDAVRQAIKIYAGDLMKTEDAVEGLNAFLEKRKANWTDS